MALVQKKVTIITIAFFDGFIAKKVLIAMSSPFSMVVVLRKRQWQQTAFAFFFFFFFLLILLV
jgi:hypothetical protein